MTGLAAGPFLLIVGDLLAVTASEGGGLTRALAPGLIELVAQSAILVDQAAELSLQGLDGVSQRLVFLPQVIDEGALFEGHKLASEDQALSDNRSGRQNQQKPRYIDSQKNNVRSAAGFLYSLG
jgi:hypothetical protein